MSKIIKTGVQRIPRRVDNGAGAKPWNIMRDAVVSIQRSGVERMPIANSYGTPRPFMPVNLRKIPKEGGGAGETQWAVTITPGYVIDSHVLNEEFGGTPPATKSATQTRIPTIEESDGAGGTQNTDIDADPLPVLVLPGDIANWLYVFFETDEHGNIVAQKSAPDKTVEVIASDAELFSIHHEPPGDQDNGQPGVYYWQIAKTISNGESGDAEAPVLVHQGIQSNLVWQESFVVSNNPDGTGAPIWGKFDRDDDEMQLRTLAGNYGMNTVAAGADVNFNFRGENRGTGGGRVTENVFVEEDDENTDIRAGFAKVAQGPSGRDELEIRRIPEGAGPDGETNYVLQFTGNDFKENLEAIHQDGGANVTIATVNDGFWTARTNLKIYTVNVCRDSGVEELQILGV